MKNPYLPLLMRVEEVITETEDRNLKTLVLTFLDKQDEEGFNYLPGQFAELSILGVREAPFGMAFTLRGRVVLAPVVGLSDLLASRPAQGAAGACTT